MSQVVHIVSADGPANVGDLVFVMCPVGDVAVGYRPRLAVAGRTLAQRARAILDHVLRAHEAEVTGGFGRCARATALTVAS